MAFQITGITRDNTGNLVASVEVYLLKYNSTTHLFTQVAHVTSDASTGSFSFVGLADNDPSYNIVAFKDGSPHTFDISDRNITPISSAYIGPGDIVAGAIGYWGMRAYSAASIGLPAIRLSRMSDNATTNIATVSGGGLDTTAINAFDDASILRIDSFYDQSGHGFEMPRQAPIAITPVFNKTGFAVGKPTGTIDPAVSIDTYRNTSLTNSTDPFFFLATFNHTAGANGTLMGDNSAHFVDLVILDATTKLGVYQNDSFATSLEVTCSSGAWHSAVGYFHTTGSALNLDGTDTAADSGGTNVLGSNTLGLLFGTGLGGVPFKGSFTEFGYWNASTTSTQRTSLTNNAKTYWGF